MQKLGIGERTEAVTPEARKKVFKELTLLWLGTLLLIRGVVALYDAGVPEVVLAAVPFLFIYCPVWLCNWRKVDSYDYHLAIPAFSDHEAWKSALKLAGTVIAIILVPWLIGYHLYQTQLFGFSPGWRLPKDWLLRIPYHMFYVAIPEEFFYRGYFQTRLNEIFPRKFLIFGTPVGWGLVIASLYFAFGHSVVQAQWWHFATFFPGLLFGWARERTRGVLAGAFLHAWANITVNFLDAMYGVNYL